MVKKKTTRRTPRRASPAKRIYRRKKSDTAAIPGAMATVGLILANKQEIKNVMNYNQGTLKGTMDAAVRVVKSGRLFTLDQLAKDAAYMAGGYVGGEVVKKYAPSVLKKPIAKISKKVPKIIR